MPHGSGDAEHLRAFEEIVLPALRRFRPQVILVSAGFDAHFADDIAMQQLSVDGYGALVSIVQATRRTSCAAGVCCLRWKAAITSSALPWCVRRTIELLRGDDPTPDPLGVAGPRAAGLRCDADAR